MRHLFYKLYIYIDTRGGGPRLILKLFVPRLSSAPSVTTEDHRLVGLLRRVSWWRRRGGMTLLVPRVACGFSLRMAARLLWVSGKYNQVIQGSFAMSQIKRNPLSESHSVPQGARTLTRDESNPQKSMMEMFHKSLGLELCLTLKKESRGKSMVWVWTIPCGGRGFKVTAGHNRVECAP